MLNFLPPRLPASHARVVEACLACYGTCMSAGLLPFRGAALLTLSDELRQLLLVTAEVCKVTAKYLRVGDPDIRSLLQACAALCDACAQSCETTGGLTECVRDCRTCAAACRVDA